MTDATPPADADPEEAGRDADDGDGGDPRFRALGDVEGILRADPTEGPDATQEGWVDDDPARSAGG